MMMIFGAVDGRSSGIKFGFIDQYIDFAGLGVQVNDIAIAHFSQRAAIGTFGTHMNRRRHFA